jgi:hypothetical protein
VLGHRSLEERQGAFREPGGDERLACEVIAVRVARVGGERLLEAGDGCVALAEREQRPRRENARLHRVGMVPEAAVAHLERLRRLTALEQRPRELDEDARAWIGQQDALVLVDRRRERGSHAERGAERTTPGSPSTSRERGGRA